MNSSLILLALIALTASMSVTSIADSELADQYSDNGAISDKMNLNLTNHNETLVVTRDGEIIVVYEMNTSSNRSIANAITELYAIGHGKKENLVDNISPVVPPQALIEVNDKYIKDICSNEKWNSFCDYYTHNNVTLDIIKDKGDYVKFKVKSKASQHHDNSTPIDYSTEMNITIPYRPDMVVIEYDVTTRLNQTLNISHALRPLPFFEVVNYAYQKISYLGQDCHVRTKDVPKDVSNEERIFISNASICLDQIPWAALYNNETAGNLGMILQSWNWSSGEPRFYAYTETEQRPNIYFQYYNGPYIGPVTYESGEWRGKVVFLAYTSPGYKAVENYAEYLAGNGSIPNMSG